MQDRFKDLAFLAKTNPVMQEREAEEEGQSPRSEEFMSSFFHNVTEVKVNLKKLDNNVKDLEERYAKQLGTVDTKEKKKVATEVNKVIDDTNSIANKVKKKLQEMANVKQEATDEAGLAEARIRKSTHTSLVQRFVEIMEQYQASQAKYQKQYRENVERQIKIVKPEVTQQEVEETVQSGNADRIFASKLVDRRAAAESALTYIKDRHDEIVKITKSLEELHNLFIDMNVLIQEQGEMINSIAFNVRSTKEHTKKAVQHLKKANKYAKRGRKCMIIIIVIVSIVVVLAIVIPIAIHYGGISTSSPSPGTPGTPIVSSPTTTPS